MFSNAVLMEMDKRYNETDEENIYSFKEVFEEVKERFELLMRMSEKEKKEYLLQEAIDDYRSHKRVLKDNPNNSWHVYEVCKKINAIAELEEIDFKGASLQKKVYMFIDLLPFVNPHVVVEGVTEFHESGWCRE
jgi:uncharacterized Fe-S cluster-containing protein